MSSIGILLINLGTPDAPTAKAVRRYLAEFLSDPYVVKLPQWLWLPILHGLVLPLRVKRSAHAYQKIWIAEGSPLLANSKKQASKLERILQQQINPEIKVVLAMRYGLPSLRDGLKTLQQLNVTKIIVLPLYPQFSYAVTGSIFSVVPNILKKLNYSPAIEFVHNYFSNPFYIAVLANHVNHYWQNHPRGEKLLLSFHGLPKKSIAEGDPYYSQCKQTAELLVDKLQLKDHQWQLVFQSRFGWQPWLEPYLDATLQELPKSGCKKIDIVCPGFAADCLETLEEIAIRSKETFLNAGGTNFNYIPALNDSESHLQALANIIKVYCK